MLLYNTEKASILSAHKVAEALPLDLAAEPQNGLNLDSDSTLNSTVPSPVQVSLVPHSGPESHLHPNPAPVSALF